MSDMYIYWGVYNRNFLVDYIYRDWRKFNKGWGKVSPNLRIT